MLMLPSTKFDVSFPKKVKLHSFKKCSLKVTRQNGVNVCEGSQKQSRIFRDTDVAVHLKFGSRKRIEKGKM